MGFLDKHIPTLKGKDAERFLEMAKQNEEGINKVDFSEQIKSFEKIMQNSQWGETNDKFEEYLEDCAEVGMKIKAIQKEEREKVIDEICAFLDEHLYTGTSTGDYDYGQEYICSDFNNATDLILTLRKKFEE